MAESTQVRTLEDIRRIKPQIMALARECRARKVSVFGSVVRGNAHADSDIDFLVDFEDDYTLLDVSGLMNGLEYLLGRKVDVIDRPSLRHEMREAVFKEAQTL